MPRAAVGGQTVDLDQLVGRVGHVRALTVLDHPAAQAPVLGLFPTMHRFSQHPGLWLVAAMARHPGPFVVGAHSKTSVRPQRGQWRTARVSKPERWMVVWGRCGGGGKSSPMPRP